MYENPTGGKGIIVSVAVALILGSTLRAQPAAHERLTPRDEDAGAASWVRNPEASAPSDKPQWTPPQRQTVAAADPTEIMIYDPPEPARSATRWIGDVLVTDPAYDHAQPAMAVGLDGALYLAVEDHWPNDGWIGMYRSTDDGASWYRVVAFRIGDTSRHPSLTYARRSATGEEWLYAAVEYTVGTTKYVAVERFNPDFTDWDHVVIGSPNPGLTAPIYPSVCTDNALYGDNFYVYVTYTAEGIDYVPVMFTRSLDYGLTYQTPLNVTGSAQNATIQPRPDIAYGAAGLFIAFEKLGWTGAVWEPQVWVTRSTNFGVSWSTAMQLTTSSYGAWEPSVAAAVSTPSVMIAYTRVYPGESDIHCAFSSDSGTTFALNNTLPWTYDVETSVDLGVSPGGDRYHAAFWRNDQVYYTYASVSPLTWSGTTPVADVPYVAAEYPGPALCVNPGKPLAQQACIAWTDQRGLHIDVYFDAGFHDGACCQQDQTCVETVESACLAAGGSWLGSGSDCLGVACCDYNGPPVASLTAGDFTCVAAGSATPVSGTASDPDGNLESWVLEERAMGAGAWTSVASGNDEASGVLANWIPAAPGYRMLRLTVTDNCGESTTAVRLMYSDQGPSASINAPLDGAIVGGSAVCIDADVHHGVCGLTWSLQWRPIGGAWTGLATGSAGVYNLGLAYWNTTTQADGAYELRLSATSVGGTKSDTVPVVLDNTAPVAALLQPSPCDGVEGSILVSGTAADANLAGWSLQWTGGDSHAWNTLASGIAPVNGPLVVWDVAGLPACAYTLRLVATDAAHLNCTNDVHWSEYATSVWVGAARDADLDHDGDVDLHDFALFCAEMTGPY